MTTYAVVAVRLAASANRLTLPIEAWRRLYRKGHVALNHFAVANQCEAPRLIRPRQFTDLNCSAGLKVRIAGQ
jgi:hypothetical protein